MSTPSPARDGHGQRHRRQADPAPRVRQSRADDGPLFAEPAWKGGSIDARFLRFHEQNGHVYRRLVQLSLDLRAKGVAKYGMKALFEVVRYEALQTRGEVVKLNNNYTSRYSRLIEAQEPRLKGFYTRRELTSREGIAGDDQ